MSSQRPIASILLPLSGGPLQATRCLEGIARTRSPSFEVIVIDDASIGLESLLGGLEGDVEVLPTQHRLGAAAAFALGCERARGEIAVLVREAATPAPGWLDPLVQALAEPKVGLAASATIGGERAASPVGSWSVAMRTADLRAIGVPKAPDELVLAALCLSTAGTGMEVIEVPNSEIEPPRARASSGRLAPGAAPELTIVVPTLDATSSRVRRCLAALAARTEAPHQVVLVENGSPPQGFSGPVNAGLRAADTPHVVVMNDDVEPQAGWWPPLAAALAAGASVCFPLTVGSPMRSDFAAWCFAIGRDGIARFSHAEGEFFDPSLVIWYQDTDLLHRLRRAGEPPVLVHSSRIRHGLSETVASEDPELRSWIAAQVEGDRTRFLAKHPDAVLDGHVLAPDGSVPALKPGALSAE